MQVYHRLDGSVNIAYGSLLVANPTHSISLAWVQFGKLRVNSASWSPVTSYSSTLGTSVRCLEHIFNEHYGTLSVTCYAGLYLT